MMSWPICYGMPSIHNYLFISNADCGLLKFMMLPQGKIKYIVGKEDVRLAREVKGASKIGVFFIPSIGTLDDITLLKACGGDFIRIGTDVSRSDTAKTYIEHARPLG